MTEHPIDREMRLLIEQNHALTLTLVDMANVCSEARRNLDGLALHDRIEGIARHFSPGNGGSLTPQQARVNGNGGYPPSGPGSLREALKRADQQAMVTQSPYPEDTTHDPAVPEQYRKAYGY